MGQPEWQLGEYPGRVWGDWKQAGWSRGWTAHSCFCPQIPYSSSSPGSYSVSGA